MVILKRNKEQRIANAAKFYVMAKMAKEDFAQLFMDDVEKTKYLG